MRIFLLVLPLLAACAPDSQVGMAGRDYEGRVDLTAGRAAPVAPGVGGLASNTFLDGSADKPAGSDW